MLDSVENALKVIEYLAERDEAGVSDISRALGVATSTSHRLLSTLSSREFVVQNPKTRKYMLGIRMFQLGSSVANRLGVRNVALINMEKLAVESGETVNLGVLEKDQVIYLEKILNDDPIRVELQVGRAVPANCTAMGKAILAFQPPGKLEEILSCINFQSRANNTISDRGSLLSELEKIKNRGYAVDNEELIKTIKCIAAPVFDHNDRVVAAISIAGPSFRLTDERISELVPLVRDAADKTSKALGLLRTSSINL